MASTICGWCGTRVHMQPLTTGPIQLPPSTWKRTTWGSPDTDWPVYTRAFQCANEACQRLSIAWAPVHSGARGGVNEAFDTGRDLRWEPSSVRRPDFPDVPAQIADTASEAHACLSISAYRGAVALARAVVEATAKDKGIVKGQLVEKIDKLAEQGHIREVTRHLAHEVREGGNEIAHGDLANEPMSSEDAEAITELMDEILQEVYQGPARMERLRTSRLEREQRNKDAKSGA